MNDAQKHCQMIAEIQTGMNLRFVTNNQFMLKHGQPWDTRVPWDRRGIPKMCFYNAQHLMRERKGLRYVEGYAAGVIPVEHGWCIDARDRVVDPTWDEEHKPQYFGVVLDMELVRRVQAKTKMSTVLFAWPWWGEIYPMLRDALEVAA